MGGALCVRSETMRNYRAREEGRRKRINSEKVVDVFDPKGKVVNIASARERSFCAPSFDMSNTN